MKRTQYTFPNEPKGREYLHLLTVGLDFCDKAVLILRDESCLSEKAIDSVALLGPFEQERRQTSEWPGTRLHGHCATAITYAYNEEFVAAIEKVSLSLFEWQHPDLPEDLCLLRPDGTPWLASIAHEHDAYLELTAEEYISFKSSYPEFALKITGT